MSHGDVTYLVFRDHKIFEWNMSKHTIEGPCNQNFAQKLDTHDTFNIGNHGIFSQLPSTTVLRTYIQKFTVDYGSIIFDYLKN